MKCVLSLNLLAGSRLSHIYVAFLPPSLLPGVTKEQEIHGRLRADWLDAD